MKVAMVDGWKERLLAAIDADERSDHAISRAAGLGPNFINQMRLYDKEPGAKQIIKLADVLGVSLTYIFAGADFTAQDEEFVQLLRNSPPEGRNAVLQLLRSMTRQG